MKRSPLRRKPKRRSEQERTASEAWQRAIFATGFVLGCDDPAHEDRYPHRHDTPHYVLREAHHTIYRQKVPKEAAWDPRNGIAVSEERHRRIHNGREPVRWDELSPERQAALREFAAEYSLTPWLERHLPGFEA